MKYCNKIIYVPISVSNGWTKECEVKCGWYKGSEGEDGERWVCDDCKYKNK